MTLRRCSVSLVAILAGALALAPPATAAKKRKTPTSAQLVKSVTRALEKQRSVTVTTEQENRGARSSTAIGEITTDVTKRLKYMKLETRTVSDGVETFDVSVEHVLGLASGDAELWYYRDGQLLADRACWRMQRSAMPFPASVAPSIGFRLGREGAKLAFLKRQGDGYVVRTRSYDKHGVLRMTDDWAIGRRMLPVTHTVTFHGDDGFVRVERYRFGVTVTKPDVSSLQPRC